jgi:hypothetical protein
MGRRVRMSEKDLKVTVNIKLNFSWLDAIKLRLAGLKNVSMSEDSEDGQSVEGKRKGTIEL